MYKRVLLACDGTKESVVALREGALIAKTFGAAAHLLIIDPGAPSVRMAENCSGFFAPARGDNLLKLGLARLKGLGVRSTGELLQGEPIALITDRVRRLKIDLIVIGHRRQTFFNRWWSGSTGGYIIDGVSCSLLVARETITDEEFDLHLNLVQEIQ